MHGRLDRICDEKLWLEPPGAKSAQKLRPVFGSQFSIANRRDQTTGKHEEHQIVLDAALCPGPAVVPPILKLMCRKLEMAFNEERVEALEIGVSRIGLSGDLYEALSQLLP